VAAAGVDLIVFACTSGSFAAGKGHDEKIIKELEEATGIPSLTTSTAILRAFQALGIRSVAISSPYSEELNARQKMFFEANGIKVTGVIGLGFVKRSPVFPLTSRPVSHAGLQEPSVAYRLTKRLIIKRLKRFWLLAPTSGQSTSSRNSKGFGKTGHHERQATLWASSDSFLFESLFKESEASSSMKDRI
jgi:hypothetical protein